MAQQTTKDWTWVVAVHPADPLLAERLSVFAEAGAEVLPILWQPSDLRKAPWDHHMNTTSVQKAAATAYKAPWRSVMAPGPVLQTRIDDDDGFALDALERFASVAAKLPKRAVLMLPEGFRVYDGRYTRVHQENNAMHSLFTPGGDNLCIYDYGHMQTAKGGHRDLNPGVPSGRQGRHPKAPAPLLIVDQKPGWLWVRHPDTISGHQQAHRPISDGLRRLFPIDWSVL